MLSISMAYNVISCKKNRKKHSKNQNHWFYNVNSAPELRNDTAVTLFTLLQLLPPLTMLTLFKHLKQVPLCNWGDGWVGLLGLRNLTNQVHTEGRQTGWVREGGSTLSTILALLVITFIFFEEIIEILWFRKDNIRESWMKVASTSTSICLTGRVKVSLCVWRLARRLVPCWFFWHCTFGISLWG